jgi:hypothetical protein
LTTLYFAGVENTDNLVAKIEIPRWLHR